MNPQHVEYGDGNSHFTSWFRRLHRAHAGRVRQFRVLASISSRGMGCVEIRGEKYERQQGLGLDKYRNLAGVVCGQIFLSFEYKNDKAA